MVSADFPRSIPCTRNRLDPSLDDQNYASNTRRVAFGRFTFSTHQHQGNHEHQN